MNCNCFSTGRIDGLGSWGGFFTGVGSFLGRVLPAVAPVVGSVLPALLQPSVQPQQASGSRLEPAATETQRSQSQDRTYLVLGGVAVAILAITLLSRRRRR